MKIKSKWILIGISGVFLFFMLVLPLISVIINSLKEGFGFYFQSLASHYCSISAWGYCSGSCDCGCGQYHLRIAAAC